MELSPTTSLSPAVGRVGRFRIVVSSHNAPFCHRSWVLRHLGLAGAVSHRNRSNKGHWGRFSSLPLHTGPGRGTDRLMDLKSMLPPPLPEAAPVGRFSRTADNNDSGKPAIAGARHGSPEVTRRRQAPGDRETPSTLVSSLNLLPNLAKID